MNSKYLTSLFLILVICTAFSQNKKDVLLTINEQPVYNTEFKKVYNKNLELVIDDSQKDVASYLDLFVDYKLKVEEAYAQGLDKEETYIKEFTKYQDQLSKNYIYDKRMTSDLVEEAYNRGLEQVNADHILIMINLSASPQDTLVAYNKIKAIRDRAIAGEDFEALAKSTSEEPGAKKSGGKLGYFSAFQMLYSFENAAYNTNVGEISEIVRTDFGYHILKVNDRKEKMPQINVSHIMIFSNKDAKEKDPKAKIDELYAMIMQGESFESIAKQFSEDKATGAKGGVIKTFGSGDLRAPLFEAAAYSIENEGDILAPIESSFGWHIIKLNKTYPIPTFEESKEELETKVKSGARVHVITQATNKKIMDKYGFKEGVSYDPYFSTYITDSIYKKKWEYTVIPESQDKILFIIGEKELKYNDFAKYIYEKQQKIKTYKSNKTSILIDLYSQFKNKEIEDYFKNKLEEENEEYASVLNEYRNGLLIFDVMLKNVWEKAKNDSVGLQKHYNMTKQNYRWKQRLDVDIISAPKEDYAQQAEKLLSLNKNIDTIKKELNTNGKVNVIITQGIYEVGEKELPEGIEAVLGVSKIYQTEASNVVVNVKEILEPSIKEYEEVKGKVISDYQAKIEEEWMQELHNKYKVTIHKKTLKKLKKELNN
jgi:peptidyl-prolyl cis-trans isomerase SurA